MLFFGLVKKGKIKKIGIKVIFKFDDIIFKVFILFNFDVLSEWL